MATVCTRFWGPLGPVQLGEAGGSRWRIPLSSRPDEVAAGGCLLGLLRLACGIALLSAANEDAVDSSKIRYAPAFAASVATGAGLLLLGCCSLLRAFVPLFSGMAATVVATVGAAAFQTGASLALYAVIAAVGRTAYELRGLDSPELMLLAAFLLGRFRLADALPMGLAVADWIAGGRLRLRVLFLPIPVCVLGFQISAQIQILQNKVHFLYKAAYVLFHFPALFRRRNKAFPALVTGQLVVCAVCSLVVVVVVKAALLCVPMDEEESDDEFQRAKEHDPEDGGRDTILFEASPPHVQSPRAAAR